MSINDIVAIMQPPAMPVDAPASDAWSAIENQIGLFLPDDYKEFIQVYGSGQIGSFLWVFNPFSRNENLNLKDQIVLQRKVLLELQSFGETIPYKVFPESGGILPFAITDNGDLLFWETIGNPAKWGVVVNESRSPEWEAFGVPMSDFLLGILSKKTRCNFFPSGFPAAPLIFKPDKK